MIKNEQLGGSFTIMEKSLNFKKITMVMCIVITIIASASLSTNAVSSEGENNSYEFVGNTMEEFNGYLTFEGDDIKNAFCVIEDIAWKENGKVFQLNEGDVIGVCLNSSNVDDELSVNQLSSVARTSSSTPDISVDHSGSRESNGLNDVQRVKAKTRATLNYRKNGCDYSTYIDSYSVAQYQERLTGSVRSSSGRVWNDEDSYWSIAYTSWMELHSANQLKAATYWGTE